VLTVAVGDPVADGCRFSWEDKDVVTQDRIAIDWLGHGEGSALMTTISRLAYYSKLLQCCCAK
jgi:hypothetical protein